jgi:hypothetical protein
MEAHGSPSELSCMSWQVFDGAVDGGAADDEDSHEFEPRLLSVAPVGPDPL